MSGIENPISATRKRKQRRSAATEDAPLSALLRREADERPELLASASGSATPSQADPAVSAADAALADAVVRQLLQRQSATTASASAAAAKVVVAGTALPMRLWSWLGVVPGRALRELREQVDIDMPSALPEARDTEARRRMRAIEGDKKAAFQCYVPDNRVCALLLDAYQTHGDTEAYALYRDFRRQLIEQECRGDDARPERERRLADLDRLLTTQLAPGARTPATQLMAAAAAATTTRQPGVVRSAADYVRMYSQAADLTQSDNEMLRAHCESTMRALVDTVNLTAKLVQAAPADTVFGSDAVHPVDKLLRLLRDAGRSEVREQTVLDYLALWQRAPELSQQDVDRQLYAYHKRDEQRILERRLREMNFSEADTCLMMAYGTESQQSPLLRAVIQILENDHFREAERAAAKRTCLPERIDAQRRNAARSATTAAAMDDDGAGDPLSRLLPIYQQAARELPKYPRVLLQQFLREPLPSSVASTERACFNRDACIAMTSNIAYPLLSLGGGGGGKQQGFICRAFEPNITREQLEQRSPTLCLLCNRYATTYQWKTNTRARPGHTAPLPLTLLQDHSVEIGEGEYNADVMLPITLENSRFNGIVKPQVMFSASHYAPATTSVAGHTLRCVHELKALDFRPRWEGAVAAT